MRKKILPFAAAWMDRDGVMLNEIRPRYSLPQERRKISNKQPNLPPRRIIKRRTKKAHSQQKEGNKDQRRKLWYIYTMEYSSAIKKNTFESVLMIWIKLEPIIQSEVSQKDKHQYNILTHIYGN